MEKEAFEPTGLIPRSIIRTVDRFVQQLLPGKEKIALQEYRVSRYQILVSIKSLLTLVLIPLLLSSTIKALLFTPLIEHFWNTHQAEIFLNQYQEKRAFSEMHDFSEKMFFESLLIEPKSTPMVISNRSNALLHVQIKDLHNPQSIAFLQNAGTFCFAKPTAVHLSPFSLQKTSTPSFNSVGIENKEKISIMGLGLTKQAKPWLTSLESPSPLTFSKICNQDLLDEPRVKKICKKPNLLESDCTFPTLQKKDTMLFHLMHEKKQKKILWNDLAKQEATGFGLKKEISIQNQNKLLFGKAIASSSQKDLQDSLPRELQNEDWYNENRYQTLFQIKSLELAKSYNKQSIVAITNLLGDFLTFFIVSLLFRIMRPELIILKSFLTESVYSLSDTTKSFLLILGMDLLVGFHSPRGWELALEGFLRHIGLPENENFILLFVALFPVFLDTVFKYWIFRYLNKISPSTVVTYHSMIE